MTTRMRLTAAGGVVAAALLVATLAPGSGAEPTASSSRASPRAPAAAPSGLPASVVGSGMACPAVAKRSPGPACAPFPIAWCCPDGSVLGVTVTGQAALRGTGAKIRDQAIAAAVADARDQAEAAAEAAGVGLGHVIAMHISSSGYPYPLEAGVGKPSICGQPGTSVPAGPTAARCPRPVPVQTFVSVTVTWAIG